MIPHAPRTPRGWKTLAATAACAATVSLLAGPAGPAAARTPTLHAQAQAQAQAQATAPSTTARNAAAGAVTHTVTLITGDVVRVMSTGDGKQAVDVVRPHGAPGGVRTETVGKRLYVYPDEAVPYLAAGKLDRRLFDVTSLIEQGYDDEHSAGLPLIVSYGAAATSTRSAPSERAVPKGTTKVRALPSINAIAVKAVKKQARQTWKTVVPAGDRAGAAAPSPFPASAQASASAGAPALLGGISKIWLDGRVHADLAQSTAQIGAPAAWAAGLDGKGVKVAVLDTGVDLNHPDMDDQVAESVSFVPGETVADAHGHGTHTASTVGGSGDASDGTERGVAPGAELLVGKVLSDEGYGDDSWVIAGMEWAVAQGAKVVSMSLGSSTPSDGTDPMSQAVNRLSAQSDALFVVAAGNAGMEGVMGAPGTADAALTVAAVDADDALASFSTMGPRYGDYALKPDIAAPGVDISAAKTGGTADSGYYQAMSGTSMATPHVAGAAAILAQAHPDWTAQQLKDTLMSTAKPLERYTAYQVGAGRTDVRSSLGATVTATGSAYFGFDAYPHSSTEPVDRTVTYRNSGSTPVTLHLALTAEVAGGPYDVDPGADAGTPAPAGMFTLSADSVTVPAHGTATVTATARPDLGADGRRYLGRITASDADGTARTRTRFGLYKEEERHDLRVTLKDRSGEPVAGYLQLQKFGEADPYLFPVDASGRADLRLRTGTYSALTFVDVAGSHGPDSTGLALLGDPEIRLDRDQELVLDARKAREATATVPHRTEDRLMYLNWYRSDGADSTIAIQYVLPPTHDSMFVLPTEKVTTGSFEYESRWRKAYPMLTLTAAGRPVAFLAQAGTSFYDGRRTLAAVHAGAGAPADYQGLNAKGRAVLVTRSDAVTGRLRARAAKDAGAALLIVVNDGEGKLQEWVGTDEGGPAGIPVVSVTARTGAPLIADAKRGRLRLAAEGVPNSPYVYDLTDPHPDRVPSDLSYRPRPRDLATVQMRFHGDRTWASGEFRWDYRPYRSYSLGFLQPVDMPGIRTDYVSAQPGTTWAEDSLTGPSMELESRSGIETYKAGTKATRNWFAPVAHPRNGSGFWWSERQQGFLSVNIQPWTDNGLDHGGYMQDGTNTLKFKVYQDGELIRTSEWASATLWPVPTVPSTYTLDLDASRDPGAHRLTPRTHSVWKVRSEPVTDPLRIDRMALMQLDYDVRTDLAGDAPGGRQRIGLKASHLPGAAGAGRIAGGTLSVSYDDGATWHRVSLDKAASGGWTAEFTAPSRGFVSLKAAAWDTAGNSISQEVTRAYGLKSSGHGHD
ncbi:S8 family serine peptidase [Streptomyces formicae]|uniref:S8 family serine peptidase n=1 Tax=Streptomyces formicae TaxID=1616117 RepID=A0ABY3WLF7_9ACTN|nr:S8 family serine peptidase [Streptomyces formicae]UNM13468.1 S8 family serine peptidase [Streptomyces formicae]